MLRDACLIWILGNIHAFEERIVIPPGGSGLHEGWPEALCPGIHHGQHGRDDPESDRLPAVRRYAGGIRNACHIGECNRDGQFRLCRGQSDFPILCLTGMPGRYAILLLYPAKVSPLFLQRTFPGYFQATSEAGNQTLFRLAAGLFLFPFDPLPFSVEQKADQEQRKENE